METLLEDAEDGSKNDIKLEGQPLRSEHEEIGAISDIVFLYSILN